MTEWNGAEDEAAIEQAIEFLKQFDSVRSLHEKFRNLPEDIQAEIYLVAIENFLSEHSGKINPEQFKELFEEMPEEYKNPETYLMMVKKDGYALEIVPWDCKTEEICLEAVKQNGLALEYVPENCKTEKFYLKAVKQNSKTFGYVPEKYITKKVCLAAVKQDGLALKLVPENRKTEEICLAAVKQDSRAFKYVPEKLRQEGELHKLAGLNRKKGAEEKPKIYNVGEILEALQTPIARNKNNK